MRGNGKVVPTMEHFNEEIHEIGHEPGEIEEHEADDCRFRAS